MRRSSAAPAGRLVLCLALGVLGVAACRSPRPGGAGDTCGRTDDCEAPLRCVQTVCRDPSSRGGEPAAVGGVTPRPPAARSTLPPLSDTAPPPAHALVGAPPAGYGGVDPTRPLPAPDENAVPAAGLPGQHGRSGAVSSP